jgi:hypothetical protein
LESNMTQSEANGSQPWPPLDRRLIDDADEPPPRLKRDALPDGWFDLFDAEASACGAPLDYIAAAFLAAVAAWIGNSRHAKITTIWRESVNLWVVIIGAPSSGKTPSVGLVVDISNELVRLEMPAWEKEMEEYNKSKETKEDFDEPAPPQPRLVAMDATIEKIQRLLAIHPRGLFVVRDRLWGFCAGFDRYKSAESDKAFYIEAWSAKYFMVDRVKDGDKAFIIRSAFICILGGMVPDNVGAIFAQADDGFAARFIFVWPRPAPIEDVNFDVDADASRRRWVVLDAAKRLRALKMRSDDEGLVAPIPVPLADDAQQTFNDLRRGYLEMSRRSTGLIRGWYGKNPGRVARLALIYEYLAWSISDRAAEPRHISLDSLQRAGRYLDYAARMFNRITANLAIAQEYRDAVAIAKYLTESRTEKFSERQLYKTAGFHWARTDERRKTRVRCIGGGQLDPSGCAKHRQAFVGQLGRVA